MAANDTDIVNLNGRADSLSTQMAANDTDITALNGRADSLSTQMAANDTDITALNVRADSLSTQMAANDTELDSIFARADSIINVLYWNNNSGVLSLDAGIDSVDIDGVLQVNGNSDLNGTLDVSDKVTMADSLDVAMSVNIQDNLNVNDSLAVNSAQNQGTVFSVTDSQGGTGVSISTVDTEGGSSSATTLTTHRLIVQDDAVYNGDMTISGSLAVTDNVTSATAPTSPNNLTNKQYVDDAIAAAVTPPQMWDYEVTNSTSLDTVYYINGDLLLYASEEDGLINYTIKVYGEDLNESGTDMEITQVRLRARGNTQPLMTADNGWTPNGGGGTASFTIGYTDISALAGGQEDGYVSCSLSFAVAGGGEYNSGLTIRFYLDGENTPPSAATFQDPQPE